jgi:two-component system, cell cycle response regulator
MTARILVVDDIALNVMLLEAKLSAEYYEVLTANDGPSALQLMAREPIDIVLLDVMMPGMSGFDVCRHIKADPKTTHIPVVMVTALDQPEDRVQGLDAGADDFLTKPVDDVALFARVRSLIRLKRIMDEWRLREESGHKLGMVAHTLATEVGEAGDILIVDTNAHQAQRIGHFLERDQHRLKFVAAEKDVLSHLANEPADLLISSLALADMDPLRIFSHVRSRELTRHLPILVMARDDQRPQLISSLELGANDYLLLPMDGNELRSRVRTQVKRKRFQDRLKRAYESSVTMALTDSLTGLYNRRYLAVHLEQLMAEERAAGQPVSLLMIDIDHFKQVNDNHGHARGDEVLRVVAERLTRGLRNFDMVARYGGEEFVVVMPETKESEALGVAERLRRMVGDAPAAFRSADKDWSIDVTVSVGVATVPRQPGAEARLIEAADKALYAAKSGGRNRVEVGMPSGEAKALASTG